jgi:outer membrane protein W
MTKLMFLSLLFFAAPVVAQNRVDFLFDLEGVHRTGGSTSYAPNTLRFEPSFHTGGGIGAGLNFFVSDRVSIETKAAWLEAPMQLRVVGRDTVQILNLGDVQFYPLSAVLQWHPLERSALRPYLGAGVVYTIMRGVDRTIPNTPATSIEFRNPTGLVVDAGLEWSLGSRWSLAGDARYVPMETTSRATFVGTPSSTEIHTRPLIVSTGVAYHF